MSLDRWLQKKRDEILKRWRDNEVSYAAAAAELFDLGVANPYRLLERT
jgi:hypothetical protein